MYFSPRAQPHRGLSACNSVLRTDWIPKLLANCPGTRNLTLHRHLPDNPSMIAASQGSNQSAAPSAPPASPPAERVTLYHWLVFIFAAAGWMFDCMGQRIFVLGRDPAMRELLGGAASDADVGFWGKAATFVLMIGWATGGIVFGTISDRFGRVKTMVMALL